MTWVLVIVVWIIMLPFVIEAMRRPMNKKTRSIAPGHFAHLPQGVTHYQWHGPTDGPVCVCVHGLTTPSFVWQGLVPHLVNMGFHVLTYDHIGRGFSDRNTAPQTPEFFINHLNELLGDQQIDKDLTLVGYSMGGVIAAAFAASQPVAISRVILLAPAGMHKLGEGLMRFIIRTPIIGSWLMLALYPTLLRRGIDKEKSLPSSVPDITSLQEKELDRRGFVMAVLSSLRHTLSEELREAHENLASEKIPVLAVWGRDDAVIPLTSAETLSDWNPNVETLVIDGAGHGLTYTHTDEVAAQIKSFVTSAS